MLIVFGDLPGTGKTTIAQKVAGAFTATYFRVNAIGQVPRSADVLCTDARPVGYAVAQTITEAKLGGFRAIVADCFNQVQVSRDGWRAVARRTGARLLEVKIVCSDTQEHERLVRARRTDISGIVLPSWETVQRLECHRWDWPHLVVDTATMSASKAVARLMQILS